MEERNEEIWKDVKGYENFYQISNMGRVRSIPRTIQETDGSKRSLRGKLLSKRVTKGGYIVVCLYNIKMTKTFNVHRLVAENFINNPLNKSCVNHKNSNRSDNRVENLEWVTHTQNLNHAFATGNRKASLTEEQAYEIRTFDSTRSNKELAKLYNVSRDIILKIRSGEIYRWSEKYGQS